MDLCSNYSLCGHEAYSLSLSLEETFRGVPCQMEEKKELRVVVARPTTRVLCCSPGTTSKVFMNQSFLKARNGESPLLALSSYQLITEYATEPQRLEALGLEYRYISRWLTGVCESEDEMVQRLKFAIHDCTRRQLTGFRKEYRMMWVHRGEWEQAEKLVRDVLTASSEEKKQRESETRGLILVIKPLFFSTC